MQGIGADLKFPGFLLLRKGSSSLQRRRFVLGAVLDLFLLFNQEFSSLRPIFRVRNLREGKQFSVGPGHTAGRARM